MIERLVPGTVNIVEFLGLWEVLHNPDFKRIEFDTFKEEAGTNAFVFSLTVPGTNVAEQIGWELWLS